MGNSTTAEGTQELTTSLIPLPVSIPDLTSRDHLQNATHQSMMLLGLLGTQAGAVHLQKEMSKMPFN